MANAYYSGAVNSFADLKSAIEGHLQAEGWSLSDGILSKGGIYVQLTAAATYLAGLAGTGQSGSTLTDPCPGAVRIVNLTGADPFSFPITYDLHINVAPDEVFCVINHSIDRYQNLSFGVSPGPGATHGQWINGSCSPSALIAHANASLDWPGRTATSSGGPAPNFHVANQPNMTVAPALLSPVSNLINQGHWIRDNAAWGPTATGLNVGGYAGASYIASLMGALPSAFNQSLVLLPMYGLKCVEDFGTVITAVVQNARHCRLDHHASGQVAEFGGDKWKLYPLYRRDVAVPWPSSARVLHSGVIGYALRYHGG